MMAERLLLILLSRYVIWTEQNFPAESSCKLKLILERCIRQFHKKEKYEKYKEDERLVQIYLKYVRYFAQFLSEFVGNILLAWESCVGGLLFYETFHSIHCCVKIHL